MDKQTDKHKAILPYLSYHYIVLRKPYLPTILIFLFTKMRYTTITMMHAIIKRFY